MGKDRRVFGNNLKLFLVKKGIASEDFAKKIGCIECRGKFSKPENKKLILDLFDIYCDVQETLAEETRHS